jgi:hypothetical protein
LTATPKLGRRPKDGANVVPSTVIVTPVGKIDLAFLTRALLNGLTATPLGGNRWAVDSASAADFGRHTVHLLTSETATCDCPAGTHGTPCKHVHLSRFLAATLREDSTP